MSWDAQTGSDYGDSERPKARSISENESDAKKRKIDQDQDGSESKSYQHLFSNFKVHKVLREDSNLKLVSLQGFFTKDNSKGENDNSNVTDGNDSSIITEAPAVVVLERKAFDVSLLPKSLSQSQTSVLLKNDIYGAYEVCSSNVDADTKATVICPATEKHIAKYSDHEPFIIRETSALYKSVTLPCLENSKFSVQWVLNILAKKNEADRIVVEDPDPETGFIIVPDMKWDGKNMDNLYLVALVHKHGIKSLRDLRKEHLPLLKNILNTGQKAIKNIYGVTEDKLRIFIHYQPSYYHFHVHFTHVKWDPPGFSALRAHMLEDVIENIKMDSDFYIKKTISFIVRDNDELYKAYKESGYFHNEVVEK